MDRISILVSLDENYLPQLHVLLTSLRINNPGESLELYLLYSELTNRGLAAVERHCAFAGYAFHPVQVEDTLFRGAPTTRQYPREMYYRLLAPQLLPDTMQRVLYLDPDILVINPLRPLWETDLKGNLFAAAAHTGLTELSNSVNRVRLKSESDYYNSGVLLMDLATGRQAIEADELFRFVADHRDELLLPDQDLLNALFSDRILPLDDALWNYDVRNYSSYLLRSAGERDLRWVMQNTAILHFCGKAKPWKPRYMYRFGLLYQHYMQLTRQVYPDLEIQPRRNTSPKRRSISRKG